VASLLGAFCLPTKQILRDKMTIEEALKVWDIAFVKLDRGYGAFNNVRLRHCALSFNTDSKEYYVRYRDVTFGLPDITLNDCKCGGGCNMASDCYDDTIKNPPKN